MELGVCGGYGLSARLCPITLRLPVIRFRTYLCGKHALILHIGAWAPKKTIQ